MEKPQILFVDGKHENFKLIKSFLDDFDVNIFTSTSGNEAVFKCLENNFDLLIIYIDMAGMDGLETLTYIQKEEKNRNIPTLFLLSEYKDEYCKIRERSSGPVELINIPICSDICIEKIKSFIHLNKLNKTRENKNDKEDTKVESQTLKTQSDNNVDSHLSQKNIRVLVVEDNPINQKAIERCLESEDCIVTLAENGVKALEIFGKNRFDCILMDVQMPQMNGVEATKKLREIPGGQNIVIIGTTGNTSKQNVDEYLASGMNKVLIKPFDLDDLIDEINKCVK